MRRPAWLVAFLPAYFDKGAVPEVLFGVFLRMAVGDGTGQARAEFDKLAVPLRDLRRGKYLESACRSFSGSWRQDTATIGAKFYDRNRNRAVLVVSPAGLSIVKLRAMDIRDKA